jgi:hypothetical protein
VTATPTPAPPAAVPSRSLVTEKKHRRPPIHLHHVRPGLLAVRPPGPRSARSRSRVRASSGHLPPVRPDCRLAGAMSLIFCLSGPGMGLARLGTTLTEVRLFQVGRDMLSRFQAGSYSPRRTAEIDTGVTRQ